MLSSDNDEGLHLLHMLYQIAEDPDVSAASRLSAIKEILDRTIGRGERLTATAEKDTACEIILRIENPSACP